MNVCRKITGAAGPAPVRRLIWLLVLMLACTETSAGVRATLDRGTVFLGDNVMLTIEADAGGTGIEPDLSPLERDFQVHGISTGRQLQIVNGRRSDTIRWTVQLEPRRTGELPIPAIHLGQAQTEPLTVVVRELLAQANDSSSPVFIEVEAQFGEQPPYVQQQIRYTVRLYLQQPLIEGNLSAPQPENAVVEQLGEQKLYRTTRNGKNFQVIERSYAIFPESSGDLHIPPLRLNGRIASPRTPGAGSFNRSLRDRFFGQNSPFGGFMQDDFFTGTPFGDPFGDRGVPVSQQSKAMTIPVRPRPATYGGRHWLPADALVLRDSWEENPPSLRAGEPATRTLTIEARGLESSQIPAIEPAAPTNVRVYPEQPATANGIDDGWIVSRSEQEVAYMPSRPGEVTFPEIRLDWWDTRSDSQRTAILPATTFHVQPGAAATDTAPQQPVAVTQPREEGRAEVAAREEDDSEPVMTETVSESTTVLRDSWPWLALAAAILTMLLGWRIVMRRRARQVGKSESVEKSNTGRRAREALQSLRRACEGNDAEQAARALLELSATRWPDNPPRNLGSLADRLEESGAPIRDLERTLYAENSPAWQGAALWAEFRHGFDKAKRKAEATEEELAPLYPR